MLLSTPLALLFGMLVGKLFNRMKGAEMIAGLVLGYFADGLYQLFFLYIIGGVIPMGESSLLISGGIGVKNTVDLANNIKYALDNVSMLTVLEVAFYALVAITLIKVLLRLIKKEQAGLGGSLKQDLILLAIGVAIYALSYIPFVEAFLASDRLLLLDAATILAVGTVAYQALKLVWKRVSAKRPTIRSGGL